jgi:hypothetical protein
MGVVPSGAYLAKKLLLDSAAASGQWWWVAVLQGGAVFTAGYVVLVLRNALRRTAEPVRLARPVSRLSEVAALALALASMLLAFAALGPVPGSLISNPLLPKELVPTLLVILGGALLARWLPGHASINVGAQFERADAFLRRWPSATIALLACAALFGGLLLAGHAR